MPAAAPLVGRLAYLAVASRRLDDWRAYATRVLGVHVDDLADGALRLRLDDKLCRLLIEPGDDGAYAFGWEAADGDLGAVAAWLAGAGVPTTVGTADECAVRGVDALLWFRDPLGYRVEICGRHLAAPDDQPLRFSRPLGGFKTGALGLGHLAVMARDIGAARRFYTEVLGLRLSDSTERPFDACFLHANARHHSFALIQNAREGLHHLMLELVEFDDVGQTYDLLDAEGVAVGATLGRHTNDHMTSFYMFTPSGFMIEYGWGGREIDVDAWVPEVLDCGPSLWGHDRTWLDDDARREAAEMRRAAARNGLKASLVAGPRGA